MNCSFGWRPAMGINGLYMIAEASMVSQKL